MSEATPATFSDGPAAAAAAPPRRSRLRRLGQVAVGGLGTVLVGGLLTYFGLIDHLPVAASPRAPLPVPAHVNARLQVIPGQELGVELGEPITVDGHSVLPGKIPVRRPGQAEAFPATFNFYRADGVEGRAPTMVVTPILGGDNEVAKIIADDLASNGYHAVIVDRRWGCCSDSGDPLAMFPTELSVLEENLRDMIADRRRVIDWLETRPEVDSARIGAYGVSLGGITTVSLTAVEPRIKASVVVMAGGDLPSVLCRSVERECVKLARAHDVPEAATADQLAAFEAKARAVVETDPLVLAPHVDPRRILMFTTRRDTSVPTFTQERLRQALGFPETFSLPTGHYSAVAYLPVITSRAREFLAEHLRSDPTP